MRKYLPRLLVIGLLSVFALPRPCAACSCAVIPPAEKIAKADVIFRGRATAIDVAPGGSRQNGVTFQVETIWKGPPASEIAVVTDQHWPTCGDWFTQGGTYLVYADGSKPGPPMVNSCWGTRSTRNNDEYLRADLRALGPGTAVAAPARDGFGTGSGTSFWLSIVGVVVAIAAVAGLALRSRLGRREAH